MTEDEQRLNDYRIDIVKMSGRDLLSELRCAYADSPDGRYPSEEIHILETEVFRRFYVDR